ncbi:hypothetical protein [Weissella viridescens]|uniref:Uncharacterized protein n=1 Tax=Weissella viridescens TaxID=1629 RepID=A0A0R2HAD8_WEIVI|nr:hypothetical protein [Weissella viridescens]KRN47068.1 hypothetical protein IV50_GL000338 [Weissella viridescens]MCB6839831.1 reductase [Weissella viridescens]MCB6846563.1 reductase [Weissella viridescens]QOD85609.1 reductase [Weissella viridescens]WJI90722.1 reductase [Weissella viridescens]
MLITVREDQLKIAMGLLSYLPEYKNIATTQREIDWYQNNPNRSLLLWQDPESRHFVAMVGIEYMYHAVVIRQLVYGVEVPPTDRLKVRQEMLDALDRQNQDLVLMGTVRIQHVVNDWREAKQDD